MKNIDGNIIKVICKYPFLVDPIVLLIPDSIPQKESLIEKNFTFIYPKIDEIQSGISELEEHIKKLEIEVEKSLFPSAFIKEEYCKRIEDFIKVIELIKCFYDADESRKYNLLNDYFGIDLKTIEAIFKNQQDFVNYFSFTQKLLSNRKIEELENTIIEAHEIQEYFQKALMFLGLEKNWNVQIGDTISIVHTNFRENGGDIIIPRGKQISIKKLLELIIHEIDGHCVQFSNAIGLFSGSIRFHHSESLLEGYALFLEYTLAGKYFGENKIQLLLEKKEIHYKYIMQKISLEDLIRNYTGNIFRVFRGFKDIETYTNLKDLVYLQGICINVEYRNKYINFEEIIQKGCINERYFEKYGIKRTQNNNFDIANTSAVHILNAYFT